MGVNFTKATKAAPKPPTVADVSVGDAFQTSFGTVYIKTADNFVKLGNPNVPSHNEVTVKSGSYFNSRQDEAVTLLGDITVVL